LGRKGTFLMTTYEAMLKDAYLEKRECVIDFPNWLLSPDKIRGYKSLPGLAIVEMAGRDSVAAAIRAASEGEYTDFIPTYAYTGTEYGDWESVTEAVDRLSERLPGIRVHELVVLGSTRFWQALNGRFMAEMISRYQFFTPCIGCHFYLHAVRISLSILLGRAPIIAGERELHDGAVKVNQAPPALDGYKALLREFDVPLILPLRRIEKGKQIEEILGFKWAQDKEQLGCVLSGNYRKLNSEVDIVGYQIQRYVKEFALPVSRNLVKAYVEGRIPDHLQVAADLLRS